MLRQITIAATLMSAGILAGCGGALSKPYPQKTRYAIVLPTPAVHAEAPPTTESLCIRTLVVNEPFDGLSMVYRTGASSFETDYYNTFVAAPDRLLTGAIDQYLSQAGVFASIFRNAGSKNCRYVLEGDVLGLYGDYTNRGKPMAVIKTRFFFIDDADGGAAVLFVRQYERSEPISSADPAALVDGWNKGMASILQQLASDMTTVLPSGARTGVK
jgi:cholesterol transport system auxiliary component